MDSERARNKNMSGKKVAEIQHYRNQHNDKYLASAFLCFCQYVM